MKKIYLIITCVLFSGTFFTQIFSDNFDSYSVGQGLVSQNPTDWDTWTPSTPNEDVLISNANSASPSNALYFSSNLPNGGPEDIILRYASVYTSGTFTLDMNILVESGKGAYFNMQETWVVAQVWAIDCFMLDDGTLELSSGGVSYLTSNYPTGSWFNLRMVIDLTANNWELFIDNVSQGSFANTTNSIGILDLYPTNSTANGGNGISGFYIDDVSYDHVPDSNLCLDPIRLEISNITNNSAKVSWTPVGTETAWNLEWGTSAFVQGNGTLVPITNTNYTITSLDSNTIYDVYVQADCGSSTTSDWIGSTFTTTGNNSVGLFDESNSNQNIFHLYPNPNNGTAFLEILNKNINNINFSIYDLNGKTISERNYIIFNNRNISFNTNSLDKGIYILQINSEGINQQQKLIVQ
ncbi:MAG: T9SS type A sorting domain-containing protein [Flavobacteriales bacterium]|nr:T9SS type A sorting domain-containing protein [Flavobacteriales bacterium]